ncbi:Fc.00g087010.m01.CDS01 [Cosmosporella sp. VM-42]
MRHTKLLYDGLWRCLCPAFDGHTLPRAINSPVLPRPAQSCGQSILSPRLRQSRRYGTSAFGANVLSSEAEYTASEAESITQTHRPRVKWAPKRRQSQHHHLPVVKAENINALNTSDVIAALNFLRDDVDRPHANEADFRHERIIYLVEFLIRKRDHPLNAFIYECMMDAMAYPKGSVVGVRKLLDDMAAQEVAPTANLCQSALKALAIHPDYTLRQEVIGMMKQYWYEIDTPAEQAILLGMLRDGQYELAFTKFEELLENKVRLDLWVYDIFIVVFGQEGFLDEMLQILQHRKHAKGSDLAFRSLLLHCLDVFSRAYHLNGTSFVWDSAIKNSLLNASNGIVENVIGTAARHGDTRLATSALEILSDRGRVFKHQYEGVVEAFARAKELPGAFKILQIMDSNAITVQRGSTRPIFQVMKQNTKLIDEAIQTIRDMPRGRPVQFEAVRVILEALVRDRGTEGVAMELYNDFLNLTDKQPDHLIMEDLILHSEDPHTIWDLAKDYNIIVVKEKQLSSPRIFNKMIPTCVDYKDWDLAFRLAERNIELEEIVRPGGRSWRQLTWVQYLVEHALAVEDGRVWKLVDEVVQEKDEITEAVQIQVQRHHMLKKLKTLKERGD